jgi:flavin-dependent dehydrogenase
MIGIIGIYMDKKFDVIVIGGGLAGLISSIQLVSLGHSVLLVERKNYPFHRVCGEFISNEVIPYLRSLDCYPDELTPAKITKFRLTSPDGRQAQMPLDLGGFGISRFVFDQWLANKAKNLGVEVQTESGVRAVTFNQNGFTVETAQFAAEAKVVVGAFGKRSLLDQSMKRPSFYHRSAYVGVKYHCRSSEPMDEISLHNFENGYCGFSSVGNDTFNLCYLVARKKLKESGSVQVLEKNVLRKNPFLDRLFSSSEFLWEKPVTVNEISFAAKEPVFNHVLMAGDAAGMVTPLSGNGMAMAIHGAKIVAGVIDSFLSGNLSREQMEGTYASQWKQQFQKRLWYGRNIQRLFGDSRLSNIAVRIVNQSKPAANFLMKNTHGQPF